MFLYDVNVNQNTNYNEVIIIDSIMLRNIVRSISFMKIIIIAIVLF